MHISPFRWPNFPAFGHFNSQGF